MHRTYELKVLLLLEGLSVPVSGGQLSFSVNQPAVASFDLVPIKEILDIRPRTFAQFFVCDYMGDNNFKLMFEGEVYSYGFAVAASGARAFRIECMDVTNYWDHAPLRFLNLDADNITNKEYIAGITTGSFAPITAITDSTNYIARELNKIFERSDIKNDVAKVMQEFIDKFGNINSFYKNNSVRYNTPGRVIAASSGSLESALKFKTTEALMQGLVENQSGEMSFRNLLNYFLSLGFHEVVTIPFPSYKNNTINQFVFKPNALNLVPPRCNVVFPNQYYNMNINRNFFSEATRVLMRAPPSAILGPTPKTFDKIFPAPGFYERFFNAKVPYDTTFAGYKDGNTSSGITGELYGTEPKGEHEYAKKAVKDFMEYSKEEYMKGIFSAPTQTVPNALNYIISNVKDKGTQEDIDIMLANTAYYMYYRGRYAQRTSVIQGRLNFSPVPGFPIMFIDDQDSAMNVVANLDNITHTFSVEGGSNTIYQVSHARQTEEKSDFSANEFSEPPVPPWFDKTKFGSTEAANNVLSNTGVGAAIRKEIGNPKGYITNFGVATDDYYSGLLGCKSCTDTNNKSIMEAARHYASRYAEEEDKEGFVSKIATRAYTTIEQAMAFMGATGSYSTSTIRSTAEYSGGRLTTAPGMFGTILKERRNVIAAYRKKLNSNKSFSGS